MCASLMHCVPTLCILSDNAANGQIGHMLHTLFAKILLSSGAHNLLSDVGCIKKDCQSSEKIPLICSFVFICETRLLRFKLLQSFLNFPEFTWSFMSCENLSRTVCKRNLKGHILGHTLSCRMIFDEYGTSWWWRVTHWSVEPPAHLCASAPLHRHGPALTWGQSVPGNPKECCLRPHFRKRHHLKSCSPKPPLPFLSLSYHHVAMVHGIGPKSRDLIYHVGGETFWGKDKGKIRFSWSERCKRAQIFTAHSGAH